MREAPVCSHIKQQHPVKWICKSLFAVEAQSVVSIILIPQLMVNPSKLANETSGRRFSVRERIKSGKIGMPCNNLIKLYAAEYEGSLNGVFNTFLSNFVGLEVVLVASFNSNI